MRVAEFLARAPALVRLAALVVWTVCAFAHASDVSAGETWRDVAIAITSAASGPSEAMAQEASQSANPARRYRRLRNLLLVVGMSGALAIGVALAMSRRARDRAKSATRLAGRAAAKGAGFLCQLARWFTSPSGSFKGTALTAAALLIGGALTLWQAYLQAFLRGPMQLEIPWRLAFVAGGLCAAAFAVLAAAWIRHDRSDGRPLPGNGERARPALVTLLSGALLWVFWTLDVWNSRFDEWSPAYLTYNAIRLLFVPMLALALIGSGRWLLVAASRYWREPSLPPIDAAAAAFFVGAAVWYIALFPLGLAGLLRPWLVVPAFLLAVAAGWPTAEDAARHLHGWVRRQARSSSVAGATTMAIATFTFFALMLQVLVNRGLAITGFEYDASGHYLPYMASVVENGSTRVNELWYHFWVSKGAGLHFAAMMLLDIQATQLVSFTMLCATAGTIGLLLYRLSGSATVAMAGMTCFASPFTYHFPYFQKHHIVTSALVAGMLWFTIQSHSRAHRGSALAAAGLLGIAAVVNAPPLAAVVTPYLAIVGILRFPTGEQGHIGRLTRALTPATACAAALVIILAVNHAMTGLMEVTPFRLFWSLADQTRFSKIASPYLLLFVDTGTAPSTGNISLLGALDLARIKGMLHMLYLPEGLPELSVACLAVLAMAAVFVERLRQPLAAEVLPCAMLLAVAAGLTLLVRQPGSIDRFYIFTLMPSVLFVMSSIAVLVRAFEPPAGLRNSVSGTVRLVLVAASAWISVLAGAVWTNAYFGQETHHLFAHKFRFASGQASLRETLSYVHQPRDAAIWPRQDVSEKCLAIKDALSRGPSLEPRRSTRIWTMTFLQEMGCHILPGTRFMLEYSNRFGEHWHRIVFGSPEMALIELGKTGVEHFFIDLSERDDDKKSGQSTSIFGCLAYSPLLDPSEIERRFRVRWTDGDAFLLVPTRKGGTPLPSDFAERFIRKRSAPQPGLGDMAGICARVGGYYRDQLENWPVSSNPLLPTVKGWQ